MFAFAAFTMDQPQPDEETFALKSCSPSENWGLAPGAKVPVPPAASLQLTLSPIRPLLSCSSQTLANALTVSPATSEDTLVAISKSSVTVPFLHIE